MNERLAYLREQFSARLLQAILLDSRNEPFIRGDANWQGDEAVHLAFSTIRQADPTRTGACTQWLIRLALAGKLPLEDLPKARETLEAFQTYKRRLPDDQRDLGRYDGLGAVWAAVDPFVLENAPVSGKDEERREREAVRAESAIVLERDGWTVAIPRTERAACWWGRGTRWCTAAERNNMFGHYAKDGALMVFVRPDGAKFQFHAPSGQFMDAADNGADADTVLSGLLPLLADRTDDDVSADAARRRWATILTLREVCGDECQRIIMQADLGGDHQAHHCREAAVIALHEMGASLAAIPRSLRDRALCLDAVRRNGNSLAHVPEDLIDREMCDHALAQTVRALSHVPAPLIDYEMAFRTVSQWGPGIKFVPEGLIDTALCAEAIKDTPSTIRLLPSQFIDVDLFLDAARHGFVRPDFLMEHHEDPALFRGMIDLLKALPNQPWHEIIYKIDWPQSWTRDREKCLEMVASNGDALRLVDSRLRDREMCLAAVRSSGQAIYHVPADLRDREICWEAVGRSGRTLPVIPSQFIDEAMCRRAVQENGAALEHVPQGRMSPEAYAALCCLAVETTPDAIAYVPRWFRTVDLCRVAAGADNILRYVYEPDDDLIVAALRNDPYNLRFIEKDRLTYTMLMEATNNNGHVVLSLAPKDMVDRALCEAVISTGRARTLSAVPDHLLDRALCLMAIDRDPMALFHVPAHLRDRDMCERAILRAPHDVIKAVPPAILDFDLALAAARIDALAIRRMPSGLKEAVTAVLMEEYEVQAMLAPPVEPPAEPPMEVAVGEEVDTPVLQPA